MRIDWRGGHDTHWIEMGHGPRGALLIHCAHGHAGGWAGLAAHLGDMAHMRAFDLPDHGRSAAWDRQGDYQALCVAMAADLCDDGPRDVIGHSFGGTVALRLAVERPDLVRSAVLIEPVFFAVATADARTGQPHPLAGFADFARAMDEGRHADVARGFVDFWFGPGRWQELPPAQRDAMVARMPVFSAADRAIMEDTAGMLAPGVLAGVTAPVLLIEGAASPDPMGMITEGLARRLGNASRCIIGGAGHMAPITHPAEVAVEIKQFLRAHPA